MRHFFSTKVRVVLIVAVVLAFRGRSLLTVALASCATVFVAEDVTFYREVEVEDGNIEERPYTVHTVTAMTESEVPVVEEAEVEPTEMEQLRADVDYLAIMTGVEL